MSIKVFERYAPRANPADSNYTNGSFKNESVPGADDGTPLEVATINDLQGFTDSLLAEAGITADGNPDTALVSQRLDASKKVHGVYGTIAKLAAGKYKDQTVVTLAERGYSQWVVSVGGSPDGVGILDAAGGNVARPIEGDQTITPFIFGGVGDNVSIDTAAFFYMRDNYDVYHIPKPPVSWRLDSNFTIFDKQTVTGDGESSLITLDDCWFGASGVDANSAISHFKIADIALKRINSVTDSDVAFVLWGDTDLSGVRDVYRFIVSNVHVLSNTDNDGTDISETFRKGHAYSLKSCYIGTVINPIMQGSDTGLQMIQQIGRSTGVNTVDFIGGEVQQCNSSAYMEDVSNCLFTTGFEGAKTNGVWMNGLCNGLQFLTTYLESNAAFDFRLSDTGAIGTNVGISFKNITARAGSEPKNHSIILDSCLGVDIDGYYAKGPTTYATSIIGNNGSGSEVQGTYKNVVEAFHNTFRNAPIAPTAQAVGTPLCDNETYGFFNLQRNTYEQDFTVVDSQVAVTELRNWALGDLANSRFGTPLKFKVGGSLSSSTDGKNISIHTNLGLIKNFATTVASEDWDLEIELLIDPAVTNSAIMLSKLLIDGQQQQLQRNAISLVGVANIIVNADSIDVAGVTCRYGNYKVER